MPSPPPPPSPPQPEEVKLTEVENEQNMHAYSVDPATAADSEAAVSAAHAAAEVVRLTTITRFAGKSKEEVAAIRIQTASRGYMVCVMFCQTLLNIGLGCCTTCVFCKKIVYNCLCFFSIQRKL